MSIELIEDAEVLEDDYRDSHDIRNRCNTSVQHRLFPIQSNWKLEESEQFKYFEENNE